MEEYNQIITVIAMSMGVAWASGINLYAAILVLGIMGATGNVDLPPGLEVLSDPMVIGAAGLMYCVEFFADKVPGVDTGWDAIHTFVRVPAGAILAAGAVGDISSAASIAAGILGGGLALGTHSLKSGSRVLINTSPEPVTNWTASIAEDLAVIGGLWTALHYPLLFVGLLIVFILLMIWLLPKIWRGIKLVFASIKGFFSSGSKTGGRNDSTSSMSATMDKNMNINESALKMEYKNKE